MGKPIYITETGIADAKDTLRAEWAESYFRAVGFLSVLQGVHAQVHVLRVCNAAGACVQPAGTWSRSRRPRHLTSGQVREAEEFGCSRG